MLDESSLALDTLKSVRSQLEGTAVDFESTRVSEKILQQLRQLMLMHIPSSITPDVRQQFQSLLQQVLTGMLFFSSP